MLGRFLGSIAEHTPTEFRGEASTNGDWSAEGHLAHAFSDERRVEVKADVESGRGGRVHAHHTHGLGTEEVDVRLDGGGVSANYNGRHRGSNWSVVRLHLFQAGAMQARAWMQVSTAHSEKTGMVSLEAVFTAVAQPPQRHEEPTALGRSVWR